MLLASAGSGAGGGRGEGGGGGGSRPGGLRLGSFPSRGEAMADIDKLNIDSIIQRLLE
ncbi:putative Serine-threonine-protein, partial [Naja naja]